MAITPEEIESNILKYWIDSDFVQLVDVREPEETATGVIEGAILLPLTTFQPDQVPEPGDKHLVLYCRSGGRSMNAAAAWAAACTDEEREVFSLAGGITGWAAKGLPIKK